MASTFFTNINTLTNEEKHRFTNQFETHVKNVDDCEVWQGRMNISGYGEIRIMFRGRRLCLKAHRVMFALNSPDVTLTSDMHVSHLCHNRLCVRVQHLSYEPQLINNKRLVCKNDGECFGHYGYKDCIL